MSSRPDPLGFLNAELDALKSQGLYRTLRVLEGEALSHAVYDHTSVVNLSSNNYLGLTTHPKPEARPRSMRWSEFGVGSGAVRTISGTMEMHMELERRLASLQARRVRGRLPEWIRRQRRHGRSGAERRTT